MKKITTFNSLNNIKEKKKAAKNVTVSFKKRYTYSMNENLINAKISFYKFYRLKTIICSGLIVLKGEKKLKMK